MAHIVLPSNQYIFVILNSIFKAMKCSVNTFLILVLLHCQGHVPRSCATGDARLSPNYCLRQTKTKDWNMECKNHEREREIGECEEKMERLKINILGICETRWTGAGKMVSDDTTVIFSCGDKHQQGVGVLLDKEKAKV